MRPQTVLQTFTLCPVLYMKGQQIKQKFPTKKAAAVDLTIHSASDRQDSFIFASSSQKQF